MKRWYIVLTIIVLILGGVGGWYWYSNYKESKQLEVVVEDYDTGNLDGAIEASLKAIEKDPNNKEALLLLATSYAQKGSVTFNEAENAVKAIEAADRVIAIDASNSEAYRIKGYAFEIQEKYDEAHANYEKSVELNPNNAQAWSNDGHAYDLQGDLAKAGELYKKALTINPSEPHALLNITRWYIRQNDFENARISADSLLSSTQINRFKAEAYQLLAFMSYTEEDFDTAFEEIDQAVALDPVFAQALILRAQIELRTALDIETQEDMDALIKRVRDDLQKALSINPNLANAYVQLSRVEIITGNVEAYNQYKQHALEAIDLDISLGKEEKEALRSLLNITYTSTQTAL